MLAAPQSLAAIDVQEDQASAGMRMIVMGGDVRQDIHAAIQSGLFADVDAELLAAAMVGVAFEVAKSCASAIRWM